MGCGVHIHAEIKINGHWEHYAQPKMLRNYQMFEKMAGVRGDVKNAIAPPRGLPFDASAVTRFDALSYWRADGHSHSWLSADEILQLAVFGDQHSCSDEWNCYLFGNYYSGFAKYPDERPDGLEDVRFVFWFDN